MLIFEYKLRGNKEQSAAIDEAIRIVQFIRNKALRLWMDTRGTNGYDLNGACRELVNTCRLPTSSRTGNSPKASVTLPGAASCPGSPTMGMSITFPSLPLSPLLRVRIVPHVEHESRKASQSGHISALVVGWCLTEITMPPSTSCKRHSTVLKGIQERVHLWVYATLLDRPPLLVRGCLARASGLDEGRTPLL